MVLDLDLSTKLGGMKDWQLPCCRSPLISIIMLSKRRAGLSKVWHYCQYRSYQNRFLYRIKLLKELQILVLPLCNRKLPLYILQVSQSYSNVVFLVAVSWLTVHSNFHVVIFLLWCSWSRTHFPHRIQKLVSHCHYILPNIIPPESYFLFISVPNQLWSWNHQRWFCQFEKRSARVMSKTHLCPWKLLEWLGKHSL